MASNTKEKADLAADFVKKQVDLSLSRYFTKFHVSRPRFLSGARPNSARHSVRGFISKFEIFKLIYSFGFKFPGTSRIRRIRTALRSAC